MAEPLTFEVTYFKTSGGWSGGTGTTTTGPHTIEVSAQDALEAALLVGQRVKATRGSQASRLDVSVRSVIPLEPSVAIERALGRLRPFLTEAEGRSECANVPDPDVFTDLGTDNHGEPIALRLSDLRLAVKAAQSHIDPF
jgi:hypothetical protein